jgi:hypothetical protein
MKRKTIASFIKEHRSEIDEHILKVWDTDVISNDRERRLWLDNDEHLYLWAKSEGVRL